MKSFYDKDFRCTPDADQLSSVAFKEISSIFKEWVAKGYSPRDISHVIMGSVWEVEMCTVMDENTKAHQKDKLRQTRQ